jgi:hypothetical protein
MKLRKLRVGDWVEIKSKEEILKTLDKNGQLENLPFMPQMFQYCGKRFKIYKRAHKTCDTVNPVRSLRIHNTVHLETRCDGEAYGGCQAACLIFWKTAWLKPVGEEGGAHQNVPGTWHVDKTSLTQQDFCTEADVWKGTRVQNGSADAEVRYVCQATQVPHIGNYLPWWDFRQYLEDYASGNIKFFELIRGGFWGIYYAVIQSGIGLGAPLRWLYDKVQSLWGGLPFPSNTGTVPNGVPTPMVTLDLSPGEMVRVKSHEAILATLNKAGQNRGLRFDAEMVPYCGTTHRVRTRLQRFIDEKTGKLVTLNNSVAVILEGATCQGYYSACRMFCPRSIYPWWREIWLERVPQESTTPDWRQLNSLQGPARR